LAIVRYWLGLNTGFEAQPPWLAIANKHSEVAIKRTLVVGRLDRVVTHCDITKCDGAGRATAAGRIVALAERVPWPVAPIARSGPGDPPLRIARWDSYDHRAQPDQIFEIALRLMQSRPDIPCPGNGPFRLKRRVPGGKFVIAVACLGKTQRSQSPRS
jgi:hypothetical protein